MSEKPEDPSPAYAIAMSRVEDPTSFDPSPFYTVGVQRPTREEALAWWAKTLGRQDLPRLLEIREILNTAIYDQERGR